MVPGTRAQLNTAATVAEQPWVRQHVGRLATLGQQPSPRCTEDCGCWRAQRLGLSPCGQVGGHVVPGAGGTGRSHPPCGLEHHSWVSQRAGKSACTDPTHTCAHLAWHQLSKGASCEGSLARAGPSWPELAGTQQARDPNPDAPWSCCGWLDGAAFSSLGPAAGQHTPG